MNLQAIIIDDEASARKTLSNLLENYCPEVRVLDKVDSVDAGVVAIREHHPQLVFLDIQMPFANGFELLDRIPKKDFEVIFTTAYDQYALKAIKSCALDYLLKPIDVKELKEAVQKASDKVRHPGDNKHFNILAENIKNVNAQLHKLILPTMEGFTVVSVKDIIRCEASRNYTNFFLEKGKRELICKNLKEYEELLTDLDFFRIHQSHLINLNHVVRYVRGRGGYVEMSDGAMVEVSRRKKDEFLARFFAAK